MVDARAKRLAVLAMVTAALAHASWSRANGAFPDAESIVLPADRPDEMIVGTNFGLLLSEDGLTTWSFVCEGASTPNGHLYQMGPPPLDRLFAVSDRGLAHSDDGACTFDLAGGAIARGVVSDAFPDPNDANRVLAIGVETMLPEAGAGPAEGVYSLFLSTDGGITFDTPLLRSENDALTSAEIARSDSRIIYATGFRSSPPYSAEVFKTVNGGVDWQTLSPPASLANDTMRIIGIDRADPNEVFFRSVGVDAERFVVTRDGGITFDTPLVVPAPMTLTSFVRLPSGAMLIGTGDHPISAAGDPASTTGIYRSIDGGFTFTALAGTPSVRALAERNGRLFAAGDNTTSVSAVLESKDDGNSWIRVLQYSDVRNIKDCAAAYCEVACEQRTGPRAQPWPVQACPADRDASPADPTSGQSGADAGRQLEALQGSGSSCSCGMAPGRRTPASDWSLITLFLPLARAPARRRWFRSPHRRSEHLVPVENVRLRRWAAFRARFNASVHAERGRGRRHLATTRRLR